MVDQPDAEPRQWLDENDLHSCWDAMRREEPEALNRLCIKTCKAWERQFTKMPTWLELALELGVDTL